MKGIFAECPITEADEPATPSSRRTAAIVIIVLCSISLLAMIYLIITGRFKKS